MLIKSEEDIIKVIRDDAWMMTILRAVKTLSLPDWWICAGFVRSKIWDVIHNFSSRTPLSDIDVIYFEPTNIDESEEKKLEEKLKSLIPNVPWSVKNQARMHIKSNMSPYISSVDGISKFPETATALGVKLDEKNMIQLAAPWGINDVVNLEVRPTPEYETLERIDIYQNRVNKKEWDKTWNRLKIYGINNSY